MFTQEQCGKYVTIKNPVTYVNLFRKDRVGGYISEVYTGSVYVLDQTAYVITKVSSYLYVVDGFVVAERVTARPEYALSAIAYLRSGVMSEADKERYYSFKRMKQFHDLGLSLKPLVA